MVLKKPDLRRRTVGKLLNICTVYSALTLYIGVLTKVDRIEPGTASKWLDILTGNKNPLPNGWFCVKQRSFEELHQGISWLDARTLERQFFASHEPWNSLEDPHRGRLGSEALADCLGSMLADLVSQK